MHRMPDVVDNMHAYFIAVESVPWMLMVKYSVTYLTWERSSVPSSLYKVNTMHLSLYSSL